MYLPHVGPPCAAWQCSRCFQTAVCYPLLRAGRRAEPVAAALATGLRPDRIPSEFDPAASVGRSHYRFMQSCPDRRPSPPSRPHSFPGVLQVLPPSSKFSRLHAARTVPLIAVRVLQAARTVLLIAVRVLQAARTVLPALALTPLSRSPPTPLRRRRHGGPWVSPAHSAVPRMRGARDGGPTLPSMPRFCIRACSSPASAQLWLPTRRCR